MFISNVDSVKHERKPYFFKIKATDQSPCCLILGKCIFGNM